MNIVIVGPGAIGGLFGSMLAWGGQVVHYLDKNVQRACALSASGFRIEFGDRTRIGPCSATVQAETLPRTDIVCFCVKACDTSTAVAHAAPLLRNASTIAVSLQNGLGNAECIAARAAGPVLCAATAQGATRLGPNRILHAGIGDTLIAPHTPPGAADQARLLADVLNASGLPARPVADARSLLWSKLVINAAVNPITALLNVRNGELLVRTELESLAVAAAKEGETIARALGIVLLYADAGEQLRDVCARTRDNTSSMLQDMQEGRRTEIEQIVRPILREAENLNIRVPVLESMYRQVRDRLTRGES